MKKQVSVAEVQKFLKITLTVLDLVASMSGNETVDKVVAYAKVVLNQDWAAELLAVLLNAFDDGPDPDEIRSKVAAVLAK